MDSRRKALLKVGREAEAHSEGKTGNEKAKRREGDRM